MTISRTKIFCDCGHLQNDKFMRNKKEDLTGSFSKYMYTSTTGKSPIL